MWTKLPPQIYTFSLSPQMVTLSGYRGIGEQMKDNSNRTAWSHGSILVGAVSAAIGGTNSPRDRHPPLPQSPTMQVEPAPSLPAKEESDPWWETEEDRDSWMEFLEANKVRPKPAKPLWIPTC